MVAKLTLLENYLKTFQRSIKKYMKIFYFGFKNICKMFTHVFYSLDPVKNEYNVQSGHKCPTGFQKTWTSEIN